ncbi:hypothetical protein D3C87_1803870 [compost metagenome]
MSLRVQNHSMLYLQRILKRVIRSLFTDQEQTTGFMIFKWIILLSDKAQNNGRVLNMTSVTKEKL